MENTTEKKGLHERNKHRFSYNFDELINTLPELKPFVAINKFGNQSIDFANPEAVKLLNKALLKQHYKVENWDIPKNYLCPPIPSRAEYIHRIADVLQEANNDKIPTGKQVKLLDIGVGANCIYPIIGHQEYGWFFVGSDIDKNSIKATSTIINANNALKNSIKIRFQPIKEAIFENIIQKDDFFDFTICNPPFHSSLDEAKKGTERKLRNLGKNNASKTILNFSGQHTELFYEGGEMAFLATMIKESKNFKTQVFWFSSLVSKSENLKNIYALLKKVAATEIKTIQLEVGNKISRIVCWTFLEETQKVDWNKKMNTSLKN